MELAEFKGTIFNGLTKTSATKEKPENFSNDHRKIKKTPITNDGRLENLRNLHKSKQNRDKLISDALKNVVSA